MDDVNAGESRFSGRHAVVTGAGSGLGAASAVSLAREGADLVLVGRRAEALEATAERVRGHGAHALTLVADVTDEGAVESVFASAWSHAPVDILVANAGTNAPGPLIDTEVDVLRSILDVNVLGVLLCCRALGRLVCAASRPATVVCVSSQMGVVGFPERAPYCASKHAVNGLTKALALEWATAGIRVNAVAPTFLHTPLTAAMLADDAFRDSALSRIPLGRLGTLEEVVAAVMFLLSDAASLITGHILAVDGGWTAI